MMGKHYNNLTNEQIAMRVSKNSILVNVLLSVAKMVAGLVGN